ncbi:MAG TPA: M23 family metallopeptidase [Dongiaceae bacterium]|nr:M23 family metallopeptidase [Dongiaceae bacterium]
MLLWGAAISASAQPFRLPTANTAIFQPGGEDRFFAATPGKTWVSGTFGCVRSDGWQMHEGLDIRSIQRDKHGEPTDPVSATAAGEVAYINAKPSLSNYGNYVLLRHRIEGLEIYSLYAHLSQIEPGLRVGLPVQAGQVIGIMGRTSNTHERIGKDRAHVHFELDLLVNDRFAEWYKKNAPGERNDHGVWNGQNLVAIDPRLILLEEQRLGAKFSLLQFLRSQTELCRVLVRDTNFPWLKRYPQFIRPNPLAEKEGVAGYEIALNFNALPFELIPRAASEIKSAARVQLLSVNDAEEEKNPARRLVTKRGTHWELGPRGLRALNLLTY